jgi:CRP-like cAMP-binding protein
VLPLARRSTVGEEMYVIKNGSVDVFISSGPDQKQHLATLQTGSFFGEGALLKGASAKRCAHRENALPHPPPTEAGCACSPSMSVCRPALSSVRVGAYSAANVCSSTYSLIYSLHVHAVGNLLVRYPRMRATIEEIGRKRQQETASMTSRITPPKAEPEPESVVYAGKAAASFAAQDRRDELKHWLESICLETYTDGLVAKGYDSLTSINAMTPDDLDSLIDDVKMLSGHAGILRKAHAERTAPVSSAPSPDQAAKPSMMRFSFRLPGSSSPSAGRSPAESRRPSATESRRPSATQSFAVGRRPSTPCGSLLAGDSPAAMRPRRTSFTSMMKAPEGLEFKAGDSPEAGRPRHPSFAESPEAMRSRRPSFSDMMKAPPGLEFTA